MLIRNKMLVVLTLVLVVAGGIMGTVGVASATSVTLSFSSDDKAKLNFVGTGDTFSFDNLGPYDFVIRTEDPGGLSVGFKGNIDGTFQIGTITKTGSLYSAPVTSKTPTTLSIIDAALVPFTANIAFNDIYTLGTGGNLNIDGVLNLSSRTYTGTNLDLISLRDNGGSAVVSFGFNPGKTLAQLTTNGANNATTYSGTITFDLVPLPSTMLLLGSGLVGLGLLGRKWSRKK